jgi:predicted carbohydrate-binding protein with CBM5 and CBM33 domain
MNKRMTMCAKKVSVNPDGRICSPSQGYAQDIDIYFDEWEKVIELEPGALAVPAQGFPKNAPLDGVIFASGYLMKKIV